MNQIITFSILSAAFVLGFWACQTGAACPGLNGRWTNREGQDFIFQPDGKALWLFKFGSSFDTARFDYRLDCTTDPVSLDLSNFQQGPHMGKTLFAILEWNSDSTFRIRYEAGLQPEVRPEAFDGEQTLKFFKID